MGIGIEEQEYNIQGLDEYIRQSEPQKRERGEAKILSEGTTPIQSADSALNLPPKCKICTLEEIGKDIQGWWRRLDL